LRRFFRPPSFNKVAEALIVYNHCKWAKQLYRQCHSRGVCLAALLLALTCLFLTGCRGDRVAAYDSVRSQLITMVFTSLNNGDYKMATAQLQRLEAALYHHPFPELTLNLLYQREFVAKLNELLAAGQVEAAAAHLTAARADYRVIDIVARLRPLVEALQALSAYQQSTGFASAQAMQAALTRVDAHQAHLQDSATFQQWRQQQQLALEKRQLQERQQAAAALVEQLQLAIYGNDPQQVRLLRELAAVLPEHPLLIADAALASADAQALRQIARHSRNDHAWNLALELAAARHWPTLSAPTQQAIAEFLHERNPHSAVGMLLRARSAVAAGDTVMAVTALRQLPPKLAGHDVVLNEFFEMLVLPAPQYRARPWRTPLPSVIDFLDRITQLREQQQ